jgi:hypothetical protein
MPAIPHLFVALSGHGFGHVAQVAPVLNALRRHLPALRLTLQSSVPARVLHNRIEGDFAYIPEATDVGLIMANAVDVLAAESLAAYQVFHADWENRLTRQEIGFKRLAPDLVLADIPYLPLAAAARLGIPAVALCSLHWADIIQAYWPDRPELSGLRTIMLEAYNSAAVFLRPAPSMPMPDLHNTRAIGPIAALGRHRRPELNRRFGLRGDEIIVLAALGGVNMPLPMTRWPVNPNIYWVVSAAWGIERADLLYWEQMADLPFMDLLCSCDVLLTKPGYGTLTEAVCNGKPVLYVERDDWPEEPWLVNWLTSHGNAVHLSRETLETGAVLEPLQILLAQPRKPALTPDGIDAAAGCLYQYLTGQQPSFAQPGVQAF